MAVAKTKKAGTKGLGKGLGKGLDTMIPVYEEVSIKKEEKKDEEGTSSGVVYVNILKVEPNRNQPRKTFKEESLNELADSIKRLGVIQPLTVKEREDYYEIVTGERRWRAARIAGLKEIPVIIRDYTEQEIAEVSLIENIQREDLNPIEEAKAYKSLITEYNLTQEELSQVVAKNRTTIANSLRLLKLDERVQKMLIEETITSGHARALLVVEDMDQQYKLAVRIVNEKLNVRDTERLVKNLGKPAKQKETTNEVLKLLYQNMENDMRNAVGAKVSINPKDAQKGKIEIEYYSQDELETLVSLLTSVGREA